MPSALLAPIPEMKMDSKIASHFDPGKIPFWPHQTPCLWLNSFRPRFVIEPSKSSIFSSSNKVNVICQTQKWKILKIQRKKCQKFQFFRKNFPLGPRPYIAAKLSLCFYLSGSLFTELEENPSKIFIRHVTFSVTNFLRVVIILSSKC